MDVLPIILYVLGAVLLVALIVLTIKLIYSVERINVLLDGVERKMKTVDKIFSAVDNVADSFAALSDRVVDGIAGLINKVFSGRKKKKREIEEEED
jgi:uncharacterized protein YoxC